MAQDEGPWNGGPRAGLGLWLCFALALAGLVWALTRAFPESVTTRDDWFSVAYMSGFALLLTAGAFRARRRLRAQHLRYAVIWIGIVALLAIGFTYQDELADAGRRLRVAASGGDPVALGDRQVVVPQGPDGHYWLVARVNGQRVRFMVDTGATETVLSPEDARRIGLPMEGLRYDREAQTANGIGYGAALVVDRFEVGPIALSDFPMVVNQAPMGTSLLGMSFLRRLASFHFEGRQLILKPRDGY
jgi:aspartyl protease family protein